MSIFSRKHLLFSLALHASVALLLFDFSSKSRIANAPLGVDIVFNEEVVTPQQVSIEKSEYAAPKKKALKEKPQIAKKIGVKNGRQELSAIEIYQFQLRELIKRNKVYPRAAKMFNQQGTVRVSFSVDKAGIINNINIVEASRFSKLNQAALKLIQSVGQFKPLPKSFAKEELNLVLPLNYKIN